MAKQFYNKDEVQQRLGCDEAEIKKLVQDGKLREFLDGAKKIYKAAEVDQLAKDLVSETGEISLAPEESGIELAPLDDSDGIPLTPEEPKAKSRKGMPSVSEDTGGEMGLAPLDTGSGLDLAPLGEEDLLADDSGKHADAAKKGASSGSFGDIALAPLGESGTGDKIRLDDTSSQEPDKDDTVITSHGVNVLDDSDSAGKGFADPMAQTQMAPDLADQIHLDSGSSGSGLLDLTREADDTSLGAELLEEIYPAGTDQDSQGAIETQVPTGLDIVGEESSSILAQQMGAEDGMLVSYAKRVEVYDPTSGAYGAALVVPLLFLGYLACVALSGAMDFQPLLLTKLSGTILYVCLGGALLSGMVVLVGRMVLSPRQSAPKAKKTAKPVKEKKVKEKKEKKDKKAK